MTQLVTISETEVTEDMIRYSMPGDCCACAIALTILESTGLYPVVWADTVYVFGTSHDQRLFASYLNERDDQLEIEVKPMTCFKIAANLSAWIDQFDTQGFDDAPTPFKIASTNAGELTIVD